eukprot:SAG31_NODE_1104_length_9889_cov_4.328396_2_plen_285_part_00
MVIAPLLVLLIFIVLGNAKGNATFVESVNLVLESPEGFSKITDIGFDAADSAITMAKESVDEVIRVNETIGATASFVEIGTYLTCIETMLMSLPDTSVVKNELDNVAIGMNLLPSTAEFDAMIGAEMETPMERTEELLVSFQNSVSSIALPLTTMIADGDISAVATELGNVLDAMTLVKSECTDLQSGISTIQGLQPSDAQFDSTIADLDDLAANFASHAGTGVPKFHRHAHALMVTNGWLWSPCCRKHRGPRCVDQPFGYDADRFIVIFERSNGISIRFDCFH